MKVKIQNFQSIKNTSLEVKGFTTVTGRTNIGKSAIVRAIEGALSNKEGDSFVKNGESFASVSLETDNLNLLWTKGSGKNDYIINEEILESVGRGSPPHVSEAGFKDIETGKTSLSVQVASQFQPIFLLDPSTVSGSVAAEVISDVGRLSEVQEALRLVSKDKRNLEGDVRLREKDLTKAESDLLLYDNLEASLAVVDSTKTLFNDIHRDTSTLNALESFYSSYEETESKLQNFSSVVDVNLPTTDLVALASELDTLKSLCDEYLHTSKVLDDTKNIPHINIPDFDSDSLIKEASTLESVLELYIQTQQTLNSFNGLEGVAISADSLSSIEDDLTLLSQMESLCSIHDSVSTEILSSESEIILTEQNLQEFEGEYNQLLGEAGTCPLCEREF